MNNCEKANENGLTTHLYYISTTEVLCIQKDVSRM